MANVEREAHVVWQGNLAQGSGNLSEGSGVLQDTPVTFAARTEQPGGKTSPEELIAAAHATCYAMALSVTLTQQGNEPEQLEVDAVCVLDDQQLKITTVNLNVRGTVPGLDEQSFEDAAHEAEQLCPVSNALRGNVDIQLQTSLAS
ncbi:MAG: Organic hydroperoxide resistance protein [uncultured Rubrobacteraceae bacterium]|uniref:Organic hydroperoxide resistance protein n=1 Tax=uncultured Rubrobacteraceae bacterium TaxID=349277 RepID=A0A6J4QB19_9ACTN|nr:MAG: Organic hydroperoxide resistance protein [uncultured Rubrobacteraceae bacterium]